MSVTALSGPNAASQSVMQLQGTAGVRHHRQDNDGDDGGAAASGVQAPTPGGLVTSLLQSLQQALSDLTPASAASGASNTDAVAGTPPIAAAAKDLGNFLQTLFQVIKGTGGPASSSAVTATDASAGANAGAAAANPAASANPNAAAVASDGDHDGSSGAQAGSQHHHGIGAYGNNLVSGLNSILQQLNGNNTDPSAGSAAGSTGLTDLKTAFHTLLQDFSGAPAGGAVTGDGADTAAALKTFLSRLIGSLQANGSTAPGATGSIINATA